MMVLFRAIDVYTLSNSGAFGEYGPTTLRGFIPGHKSIPLYTNNLEAFASVMTLFIQIDYLLVHIVDGATQGIYALETYCQ